MTTNAVRSLKNRSILLVDDDVAHIRIMGRVLSDLGRIRFATDGEGALRQMQDASPDLVLLDAEMPGMSGYEVCAAMQSDAVLRDVPVIFVTGHSSQAFELDGLAAGAVDFIAKPISAPLLVARAKTQLRLKRLTDELRAVASIDGLTGLPNRRSFDEALMREWHRAVRAHEPVSLLMVDVDHFKLFNDRYGHPAGDACLLGVAKALSGIVHRPTDLVARYGGEEFVLLLPDTPPVGAHHMARRVLSAIDRLGMRHEASPTAGHLSVSVGVGVGVGFSEAECGADGAPTGLRHAQADLRMGPDALLRSADQALYAAKALGRARACWLGVDDVDVPERSRAIRLDGACRLATVMV